MTARYVHRTLVMYIAPSFIPSTMPSSSRLRRRGRYFDVHSGKVPPGEHRSLAALHAAAVGAPSRASRTRTWPNRPAEDVAAGPARRRQPARAAGPRTCAAELGAGTPLWTAGSAARVRSRAGCPQRGPGAEHAREDRSARGALTPRDDFS